MMPSVTEIVQCQWQVNEWVQSTGGMTLTGGVWSTWGEKKTSPTPSLNSITVPAHWTQKWPLTLASKHFLAPNYLLNMLLKCGQFIKEMCIITYRKVQLSQSMQLRHIGGAEVAPHILNLVPCLLYPQEMAPVPTELGGPHIQSGLFLKNRKSVAPPRIGTPDSPACSWSLYWLYHHGSCDNYKELNIFIYIYIYIYINKLK